MGNKDRPDLLLVNPGGRTQVYQFLGSTLAAIEPPVWAGMMATFIRKQGNSVRILDARSTEPTTGIVSETSSASPRQLSIPH